MEGGGKKERALGDRPAFIQALGLIHLFLVAFRFICCYRLIYPDMKVEFSYRKIEHVPYECKHIIGQKQSKTINDDILS
jgi:hypothetical protein